MVRFTIHLDNVHVYIQSDTKKVWDSNENMRQCHRQTGVQATRLYSEFNVCYPRTQLGVRSFSCLCYPVKRSPRQKSAGIERAHVASSTSTYIQWWWKVQQFPGTCTRVSSHWQGSFCPMFHSLCTIYPFSEDIDEVLNENLTTCK